MIKLGLCGSTGSVGQSIENLAKKDPAFNYIGGFSRTSNTINLETLCKESDVIIDFSHPDFLNELLNYAQEYNTALVIGTTGYSQTQKEQIYQASNNIPILYSANLSIGANLLFKLSELVATKLDQEFDIEISELHHRRKKDSPSGTASQIFDAINLAKGGNLVKTLDRDHVRKPNEVGIAINRGGEGFCNHDVMFIGDYEMVKLNHIAINKQVFAIGAIKAAKWLYGQSKGSYTMLDVLSLNF